MMRPFCVQVLVDTEVGVNSLSSGRRLFPVSTDAIAPSPSIFQTFHCKQLDCAPSQRIGNLRAECRAGLLSSTSTTPTKKVNYNIKLQLDGAREARASRKKAAALNSGFPGVELSAADFFRPHRNPIIYTFKCYQVPLVHFSLNLIIDKTGP